MRFSNHIDVAYDVPISDQIKAIGIILLWPVTLPTYLLRASYISGKRKYDSTKAGKENKLDCEKLLAWCCARIQNNDTSITSITISLEFSFNLDSLDGPRYLEYDFLPKSYVIEQFSNAFSKNQSIITAEFVGSGITYSDIHTILKNNTSVQNIRLGLYSIGEYSKMSRLLYCPEFQFPSADAVLKAQDEFIPREGNIFVVNAFTENLELYSKGSYSDSRYASDRHSGRAAQFMQKLKVEKIETRVELENAIKDQLSLWFGKNIYLERGVESEIETPDFYSRNNPKKHAKSLAKKDYGTYFHLLADVNPSLKQDFFLQMYTAHMKGELKLEKADIEALHDYCQIPDNARELETLFQDKLVESTSMQEAAQRSKQLFTENIAPKLLANLIAPTGLFKVEPITNKGWEHLKHHAPYVVLGITAAVVLALNGGWFTVLVAAGSVESVVHKFHVFDEWIHAIKGLFIHGSDLTGHEHLPSLWSPTKRFLGVEADTRNQIEYFNASVSSSLKDPAEMFTFSQYLLGNLSKNLPLSQLHFVTDSHHTHIEDIRILAAFVLCISCLSLGYLPQGKHEIKTDANFLNKLMLVVTYLGPSLQDIKQRLSDCSSPELQPKLKRGLMKASYKNELDETVTIQWRWHANMKLKVKPFNRTDAITLAFEEKAEENLEHDAMPFEIELLKSILRRNNQDEPVDLPQLSGAKFMEAKIPEIFNDEGISITSNEVAMQELRMHMDNLQGIEDFQEYKTTQVRLNALEQKGQVHDEQIDALKEENAVLRNRVDNLEALFRNVISYQSVRPSEIEPKIPAGITAMFNKGRRRSRSVDDRLLNKYRSNKDALEDSPNEEKAVSACGVII